jgi:hypothetical protein
LAQPTDEKMTRAIVAITKTFLFISELRTVSRPAQIDLRSRNCEFLFQLSAFLSFKLTPCSDLRFLTSDLSRPTSDLWLLTFDFRPPRSAPPATGRAALGRRGLQY